MASKRSWDFYYRTIHRLVPEAEHEQIAYFQYVRKYVRPGIKWLDAGCGHTLVPEWMKGSRDLEAWFLNTAAEVVGCDVSLPALTAHSKIKRVACNLEQLCFQQDNFDLITCNVVVEHVENPAQAFREFFRALKPGGVLLVHTPNLWHWGTMVARVTPHWFHQWAARAIDGRESDDVFPTLYRANTGKELRRHLVAAGFTDTTINFLSGRPMLVGFGPFLYLECLFHRAIERFPQLGQSLCAVARRSLIDSVESSASINMQSELGSALPQTTGKAEIRE